MSGTSLLCKIVGTVFRGNETTLVRKSGPSDDCIISRHITRLPPLNESSVVLRRIDPHAGLIHNPDRDRVAGLQHTELLQLLGLF